MNDEQKTKHAFARSRSNVRLEVKRFIALMLFLSAAILECVIAWAVSLPDMLIIPAGIAYGYWVMPIIGERLINWATSNGKLTGGASAKLETTK